MREFKRATHKQLGELLIERGIITRDQLEHAISYQKQHGGLIGEVFVALNFATERDIAQVLTYQYGFPYLPLLNYEIDPEILTVIPEELCRQQVLIPIDMIGKSLTIAMANPLNVHAIADLEEHTGCLIQVFVSTSSEIKESIDKYYSSSEK